VGPDQDDQIKTGCAGFYLLGGFAAEKRKELMTEAGILFYSPSPRPSPIKGEGAFPDFYDFMNFESGTLNPEPLNPEPLNPGTSLT
jgi:hypothetical protein